MAKKTTNPLISLPPGTRTDAGQPVMPDFKIQPAPSQTKPPVATTPAPAPAPAPVPAPEAPPPTTQPPAAPGAPPISPVEPRFPTTIAPQDTVQGRIQGIIAEDSPLMELARTQSKQYMNQRGLLNSSMAAQAGESAVLGAAGQIAQQDASIGAEFGLQNLRGQQAQDIAKLENDYKILMQANESAGQFFSATSSAISNILAQPDIPGKQKQALIDRQIELLRSGMSVIGGISNLDLAGLLDFDSRNLQKIPESGSDAAADKMEQRRIALEGYRAEAPNSPIREYVANTVSNA